MIVASLTQIAAEAGRKFATEHPFADGNTVMKLAAIKFETPAQRHAFLEGWRQEAGF